MLVRRGVWENVGGLNEQLAVGYNDVDFCLRVREAGYLNVFTPYAELYHHESKTRGQEDTPEKIARFEKEKAFLKKRWGKQLQRDPYYNPNLTIDREDFTLS
jgi:GT2 family glycosyltransferase